MSTYYMIDLFDDVINGVETPDNGEVPMVGTYVVKIPQGISVRNPVDLTDLLDQKYDAIFASHAGFSNQEFDDFLDATGVNTSASSGITLGKRGMISLYEGGILQTVSQPLGSTPSQAIINFEVFEVEDSDPATGLFSRTYKEVEPIIPLQCEISFDNGSTWLTVSEDALLSIPGANQGNQMVLKFTHVPAMPPTFRRLFLGGWSVVY